MSHADIIQEVLTAYNSEELDKDTLINIMSKIEGETINQSVIADIRANDGLSFEEMIVKVMEPEKFEELGVCPVNLSDPDRLPPEESELWVEFSEWVSSIGEIFDDTMRFEWVIEVV